MASGNFYNDGRIGRLLTSARARKRRRRVIAALIAACAVLGFASKSPVLKRGLASAPLDKAKLAQALGRRFVSDAPVPMQDTVKVDGKELAVQYSLDTRLQQVVEQSIRHGKVPYAAFVALDARTGQVLAMASHGMRGENMNLRATYPAASIFKIVTAAAALEGGKITHDSMIPVRGGFHTLYRRNVLAAGGIDPSTTTRFARLISFEDALAKSVNSVFGKVGLFGVGPDGLRKVASRFQFGSRIPFELPLDESHAMIPNDEFGVAESASGYTRLNTLNPVHGALIAAAVANDGIMMEPSIVTRAAGKDGQVEYAFEPHPLATVTDKATANELSVMMHRTVVNGTSRRAFRGAERSMALNEVFIGGKTGTLSGWDPKGRYDWFVGFGEHGTSRVAVAALCVHGSRRGVKASQLARQALESYFRAELTASR
jgi:cell division protein FtsI/penicillin-binding protein 2